MLRALARAASSIGCTAAAPLEAPGALRQAVGLQTLTSLRGFSSQPPSSSSDGSDGGSAAATDASSSSSGRPPSRSLQSKEWRSWIDTKLDSKLEAAGQQEGGTGAAEEAAGPAVAAAAAAPKAAPKAAAPAKPAVPHEKRVKGFELEQQIFNIVAPARPKEDATLPEGVTTYGQLAMAVDAPRFRYSGNVTEISPQRIHPTRLFFPQTTYAPAELDPYKTDSTDAVREEGPGRPPLNPDEVTRLADYKNAPMLALFLSDAGKLPLRHRTGLRAKLHRHLARQVKIARTMGILSPTEKWQPQQPEGGVPPAGQRRRRQQKA